MNARPEQMTVTDLRLVVGDLGACRALEDPDVMFPHSRWDPDGRAEAAKVCAGCGVREYCLELARRRGEQYGVWGGRLFTTEGEKPLHSPDEPGHVERLPSGSLRVSVYVRKDRTTGKQIYLRQTVQDEDQAQTVLGELLRKKVSGVFAGAGRRGARTVGRG